MISSPTKFTNNEKDFINSLRIGYSRFHGLF